MADILSKQYANVFSEPISPDTQTFNAQVIEIPDMIVTENDIQKAIDELSPSGPAAEDGDNSSIAFFMSFYLTW